MKKTAMLLLCTLLLTGCEKGDSIAYLDVPTVIDQPESSEKPGCLIEIPQIIGSDKEAALAINNELQAFSQTMQDTYMNDEVMWCDVTAWPTENERYLNITLLVQEFPCYGTYGQILSWVYDKENSSRVDLDEALAIAETDMDTIYTDIAHWAADNDYLVTADVPDFLTFRMLENGAPQFMAGAGIVPEGYADEVDPWSVFFTWTQGEVECPYYIPFAPDEVTGSYSNELWCQSYEDSMGQYEGDPDHVSEAEAMELFQEIYEINRYLEDGYEMRFDGNTVEIDYETCICAVLAGK